MTAGRQRPPCRLPYLRSSDPGTRNESLRPGRVHRFDESGDTVAAITPSRNGSAPPAVGEAVTVTWRRGDSFVLDA